jgi:diadenylate cyclase
MLELFSNIAAGFGLRDLVDVALVSLIVYRVFIIVRGTNAVQMITGLLFLGFFYIASNYFKLYTIHWLLRNFFDNLFLIVIVLFQDDIRRALAYMGKNPFLGSGAGQIDRLVVDEIAKAASRMARDRIGALIVIERETGLKNFIDTGAKLDAKVRSELLYSIFIPSSPIHDGAVIVKDGRIAAAGCFLPLTKNPNVDKRFGTRHRAAIGLTEDTDAVVVLVSEEAGATYLVKGGRITGKLPEEELAKSLAVILELMDFSRSEEATSFNGPGGRG